MNKETFEKYSCKLRHEKKIPNKRIINELKKGNTVLVHQVIDCDDKIPLRFLGKGEPVAFARGIQHVVHKIDLDPYPDNVEMISHFRLGSNILGEGLFRINSQGKLAGQIRQNIGNNWGNDGEKMLKSLYSYDAEKTVVFKGMPESWMDGRSVDSKSFGKTGFI